MVPYFKLTTIALGPLRLPVFGLLLTIAILLIRWRILRSARKGERGDQQFVSTLFLVMLVCGLLGAHFAKIVLESWPKFVADPLVVVRTTEGIRSAGGLYGGLFGGIIWCKIRGLSASETLRRLDSVISVLPVSWALGRLGCALIHDHIGRRSDNWMAVRFPGGSAYDLGLIEFVFLIALSVAFWFLSRQTKPAGFFLAVFGFVYGGFRAWLDTLQVHPFGWDFYLGLLGMAIGATAWFAMRSYRHRAGTQRPWELAQPSSAVPQ